MSTAQSESASPVDAAARAAAIDSGRSFCITAPAGSGKTELLIQRYLALLAKVDRPEQVLAITFTRKAAAEMLQRVVDALHAADSSAPCGSEHQRTTRELAEQVLVADRQREWHLLRDSSRIHIKTIDSFCGELTRQMPVLSEFGGQASPQDDAGELYAEAVIETFRLLDSQLPVAADLAAIMLHFDNNWEQLQELLTVMLAKRDQWRGYVGVHHQALEAETFLLQTVRGLVTESLGRVEQLLSPHLDELLTLRQFAAANLGQPVPEEIPAAIPEALPVWRGLGDMMLTQAGEWRLPGGITKKTGFPADKGAAKQHKEQFKALLPKLAEIETLHEQLLAVRSLPEIDDDNQAWQLVLHMSRLLPMLAAQLLLVFQRRGCVDHCQVALSALQALGDDDSPTDLALKLDYQIEHILVDEFQDTAINQYELLGRLTRGWGQHNAENPGRPRTLMIVGDAMQSIYGFRDANVGLFLKAQQRGFNGLLPESLQLQSNFRSDQGVVDWVNETFVWSFPPQDDISRGQVSYRAAAPVRPAVAAPAVSMEAFQGDGAREQELEFIAQWIADALEDGGSGSIAVLARSRSHLQPLIALLKRRQIPYSATDLDSLARSGVVADLHNLCRALVNRADRLAWLALLRAPWCGLQLRDLLLIGQAGEFPGDTAIWAVLEDQTILDTLSEDGRQRIAHVVPILRRALHKRDRLSMRVWVEQAWTGLDGPACALEETQLQDAEDFFQLLEEVDRDGGGLGLKLEWLAQQLEKRYSSAGDIEARVQLMTLHKAKGLEFDRVIIPQLARRPRSDNRQLLLWDEHSAADGGRGFLLAADDHSEPKSPTLYNYLKQKRREKSLLENNRLLYVGATRAISQLLLTASLNWQEKQQALSEPAKQSLLHPIWPTFSEQMTVHESSLQPQQSAAWAPPRLRRLALPAEPLEVAAIEAIDEIDADASQRQQPEFTATENFQQRAVGTVVHLALEQLSRCTVLPAQPGERDLERWRWALGRAGIWGPQQDRALAAVEASVTATLRDVAGRWLLASDHQQARSEWPLTAVDSDGRILELVIDRSFIDREEGCRWLLDYKNSQPREHESIDSFIFREVQTYLPQLLRYRRALSHIGTEPLRCALYFTALGRMQHIAELDT